MSSDMATTPSPLQSTTSRSWGIAKMHGFRLKIGGKSSPRCVSIVNLPMPSWTATSTRFESPSLRPPGCAIPFAFLGSFSRALTGAFAALPLHVSAAPPPFLTMSMAERFFTREELSHRFAAAFDDAGTFKISKLCSKFLTDFHRDRNDLSYLTKDLEIAEKYARYAQRRVSLEKGCVLSFAIPNELCANSRQIYGRDWQELVWWSRRPFDLEENSGLPPTSLDDYLQAPVLIGCICGTATDKISRLENSGELTGQYMKKRDGGNASQHVFQSVPILLQIQSQCTGWTWFSSTDETCV